MQKRPRQSVRNVLFQCWDDTVKPYDDEGNGIVPPLAILWSLLLNLFLKWGVSKPIQVTCVLEKELTFVVLSFLLGAMSQPFFLLCGPPVWRGLSKFLHSHLTYSMAARLLEKSCLVSLPAKWWTDRNLEVQKELICRLLSGWLLSNPVSHTNLGKQTRKATVEQGAQGPHTCSPQLLVKDSWVSLSHGSMAFP